MLFALFLGVRLSIQADCVVIVSLLGFSDDSVLLKHELAYCLGQMKVESALPVLEYVLRDKNEDPMVRHEVRLSLKHTLSCLTCRQITYNRQQKQWAQYPLFPPFLSSENS